MLLGTHSKAEFEERLRRLLRPGVWRVTGKLARDVMPN